MCSSSDVESYWCLGVASGKISYTLETTIYPCSSPTRAAWAHSEVNPVKDPKEIDKAENVPH